MTYIKRVFYAEQATLVSGNGPRLSSNLKSCKPRPIPPHFAKLTEKSQNMSYHFDHKSTAVVLCLLRPTPPLIDRCPPYLGPNSLAAKGHHAPVGVSVWALLLLSSVRCLVFFHPSKRQNAVGGSGILSPVGRLVNEQPTSRLNSAHLNNATNHAPPVIQNDLVYFFSKLLARLSDSLTSSLQHVFNGAVATRRVRSGFSSLLHILQG